MIDTHCHLNFERFDEDRDEVVQRARSGGVTHIIVPSVDLETLADVYACSQAYKSVSVAVGIHPNSTAQFNEDTLQQVASYVGKPAVVAIGEIGLDYHWDKSPKFMQKQAFQAQLDLARKHQLPVIIHNREASDDVISILEVWSATLDGEFKTRAGVLHSFSAPMAIAERALEIGFYLGFTGPITFKKADDLREVVKYTPLDRILVETDAPFLTPHPYRGKRNEPSYIPYMIEKIAEIKQLDIEEVVQATTANAKSLFRISV